MPDRDSPDQTIVELDIVNWIAGYKLTMSESKVGYGKNQESDNIIV